MEIERHKRIIILGSGFGGLYAALRLEKTLARDPDVEILLVNRENFFLYTPMLHEVAASDLDLTHIVNPVRKLLKRVQFFDGDVDDIDLLGHKVCRVTRRRTPLTRAGIRPPGHCAGLDH